MNFLQGLGAGVGGLLDGYRTGVSDDQVARKLEAELAYKKQEAERQQALLAIQQAQDQRAAQTQATQMEEIARRKAAEQELVQRLAPQKLVENGIPTELGQGLLGKIPEYQDAMVGPYADPQQAIQRQENPAWRQGLETLQQRKEIPANPLNTQELASFGVRMGDKNILERLIPKQDTMRADLLKTGKYEPQSVDDFLSGKGQLKFAKDPAVVTWSDPFEANIGGKRALVQKSSTGQIKPVIEDKSTTIINRGGDGPLAQSTFVDPQSGLPLVYDKKSGSYRVADVQGGVAKQLNPKTSAELATNEASIYKLDNAIKLATGNPSAFGVKNYLGDEIRQRTDPGGVDARAAVADIGSLKIHDRSGAAVTASEFPRLKPFIPLATDNPATVTKKLKQFKAIVAEEDRLYRNSLSSNGYRVGGSGGNSGGGKKDPLGLR